jgi:nicotinamidase-related amidase
METPAHIPRLEHPAVLLIDAQPGFFSRLAGIDIDEAIAIRWEMLLAVCRCLELPTLATFEEPEANGWLSEGCEREWPAHGLRFVKRTFDCCGEPQIAAALSEIARTQVVVAGGETDVCVLQSVLSLLARGHEVYLLEDCMASTEPHTRPALDRMYAAGAVPCTLKTLYYELMKSVAVCSEPESGGPGWAALLRVFDEPEALPEWRPAD